MSIPDDILLAVKHQHATFASGPWAVDADALVVQLVNEVIALRESVKNHQRVVNYWFPRLGYDNANEMVYPALGDSRAKPAPALERGDTR